MAASKMTILSLALASAFAPGILAMAPLSNDATTRTAPAQEIGSMTSDGALIYSMNYCTIIHTTECQLSLSTGPSVPDQSSETPSASEPVPTDGATNSQSGTTGQPGVSGTNYPSPPETGIPGGPITLTTTGTDGQPTTIVTSDELPVTGSAPNSGVPTVTGTSYVTVTGTETNGEGTGTATDTAATQEATAAGSLLTVPAAMAGLVGVLAYIV